MSTVETSLSPAATAAEALRRRLGVSMVDFARIVGVDTRTVLRWQTGNSDPSGAALAVVTALREKLDQDDPVHADEIIAYVVRAGAVGGLSYLLLKLLYLVTDQHTERKRVVEEIALFLDKEGAPGAACATRVRERWGK